MNDWNRIEDIRARLEIIKDDVAELGRKVERFRKAVEVLRRATREATALTEATCEAAPHFQFPREENLLRRRENNLPVSC